MPRFITVAHRHEIPEGEAIAVRVNDERVAVFNVDGSFYAISDMCAHAGGPLSEGWVDDKKVTCPWHGWQFDLVPEVGAPDDGMRRYPVRLDGDAVQIEVDD